MPRGVRKKMTNDRVLVSDVVQLARSMPLAPLVRDADFQVVDRVRKSLQHKKVSWTVLMMKAYALVAQKRPEMRQIYVPFPWPHIYQHSENVAMLTVTRETLQGPRLFFARFNQPENLTLEDLQDRYDHIRRAPVREIKQFIHQRRFAKCPKMIRKMAWWSMTHLMPSKLAQQIGTFGMSLSQLERTYGVFHLGPTTTTLGYEHFAFRGKMRLTLTFDHRILDGKHVYDILNDLEFVLNGPLLEELYMMRDGIDVLNPEASLAQMGSIDHLPHRKVA